MPPRTPAPPETVEVCPACEGRKLLCTTVTKHRWLLRWKMQRFRLCRTCNGTGGTTRRFPLERQEVNMAGKHRRNARDKKPCKWCKGKGEFHSGAISIRCGRCGGTGQR